MSDFVDGVALLIDVSAFEIFSDVLAIYDNKQIINQLLLLTILQKQHKILRRLRISIEFLSLDRRACSWSIFVIVLCCVKVFEKLVLLGLRLQLFTNNQQNSQKILMIKCIAWINSQLNNESNQFPAIFKEHFKLFFNFK